MIIYSVDTSLGPEFLHLASSYYDKENKTAFCGFRQKSIGSGINEGYTELLASRIYNEDNKITAYYEEVKIAKLLEFFFDNPKDIENLYFNCNLSGLISYLENYAERSEIIKILLDIDYINSLSTSIGNLSSISKYLDIQITLYNWFVAKNKDSEKLQQFKELIFEDKMILFIINNPKFKLYKEKFCALREQAFISEEQKIR